MSFFQVRRTVDAATADDDKPPQGYVFNEIVKLTDQSDSVCRSVQEQVVKRLRRNQPKVKLKALQVIKYCLEKGHPSFKKDMHQRVDVLREASQYTGPPDPLEGDAPYRKVREEAGKVMNMLYDTSTGRQTKRDGGKKPGDSIEGEWKPEAAATRVAVGGGMGSGGSGRKVMQGLGNWEPPKEDDSRLGKFTAVATSAWETVKAKIAPGSKTGPDWNDRDIFLKVKPPPGASGGYVVKPPQVGDARDTSFFEKKSSSSRRRGRKGPGGMWRDEAELRGGQGSSDAGTGTGASGRPLSRTERMRIAAQQQQATSQQQPAPSAVSPPAAEALARTPDDASGHHEDGGTGTTDAHSDGEQEEAGEAITEFEIKVVDDMTAPGGMRAAHSPEELQAFVAKAKSMNVENICELLDEALEHESWQVRVKSLNCIEALLQAGLAPAFSFFTQYPEALQDSADSDRKSESQCAHNCQRLLSQGPPGRGRRRRARRGSKGNKASGKSPSHTSASAVPPAAAASPSAATATAPGQGDMLFSFLDTQPGNNGPHASGGPSAPAASGAVASGGDDFLAAMTQASTTSGPVPSASPTYVPVAATTGYGMMGGYAAVQAQQQQHGMAMPGAAMTYPMGGGARPAYMAASPIVATPASPTISGGGGNGGGNGALSGMLTQSDASQDAFSFVQDTIRSELQ